MDDEAINKWADDVISDLEPLLPDFDTVYILAGADYFEPVN